MALVRLSKMSAFGQNARPSDGALLYVYEVGTTTPKTTYTDEVETIPHAHPIVADGNGVFAPVYLSGFYKEVLKDKNDVQISSIDSLQARTGSVNLLGDFDSSTNSGDYPASGNLGDQYKVSTGFTLNAASGSHVLLTDDFIICNKNSATAVDVDWEIIRGIMPNLDPSTTATGGKITGSLVKALTDGANIATDCEEGSVFTVTLSGNRTLDNPTNKVVGKTYTWEITQDGTGGRTLAFGSDFDFRGSETINATGSATTTLKGTVISSTSVRCEVVNSNVGVFGLTDGANIATDCLKGSTFMITLAGNRTLDNPTNKTPGKEYTWVITQDGTGGRTLAFGSDFNFETPSRLRASASTATVIRGIVLSDTEIRCNVEGVGTISKVIWRMVNTESTGDQNPLGNGGSDWALSDGTETEFYLGSATQITESSGIFSFGSIGYWSVTAYGNSFSGATGAVCRLNIRVTSNDSTYNLVATGRSWGNSGIYSGSSCQTLLKISDIAQQKLKLEQDTDGVIALQGSSTLNVTYIVFEKLSEL